VNETLARLLWPNADAVGRRLDVGCRGSISLEVVGVVRDSKIRSLSEASRPHLYRPFPQHYTGGVTAVIVETRDAASKLAEPVRRAILGLGRGVRVYAVQPLDVHVAQSFGPLRLQSALLIVFGALALCLAAAGLYGIVAYRVSLRTREVGIRLALGAPRIAIVRQVLRDALAMVLTGIALGQLGAVAVSRALPAVNDSVAPITWDARLALGAIWILVTAVACYIPARRATKVDPLVALRYE
jgi:putative ABC transport system permease protein